MYVVVFLRYSGSKNGVTLKLGLVVVQALKIALFDRPRIYDFLLVHCKYSSLSLVQFLSYLTLNNIVTLKYEVTQDHSYWYHSEVCVRFPIHLS